MPAISSRYANIDIVRGLAALLVVWMHASEVFRSLLPEGKPGEWMFWVAHSVDFGRIGVVAFFAVSGFVISASFNHQGWLGFKIFWIRRFFRLYPAYWLSIPLAIWSTWIIWDKPVTLLQIMANISIVPGVFHQEPLQGLYWTLQVEMIFYVSCSVLFLLGFLRNSSVIALVTGLLFSISLAEVFIRLPFDMGESLKNTLLFLCIMFWGALYRTWHTKKKLKPILSFILWGVPIALLALTIQALLFKYADASNVENIIRVKSSASLALGLLLFLTIAHSRSFTYKPLVILGEISYALYLFHPIVIFPVYWLSGRPYTIWIRTMPLEFWVFSTMLASVLVAYFVHRWVELPAIRKGREITRRMSAAAQ